VRIRRRDVKKGKQPSRLPARFEELLSLGRREKDRDCIGDGLRVWEDVEISSTFPYPITTTGTSIFSRSSYRKLSLIKCLISICLSPFLSLFLSLSLSLIIFVGNLAAALRLQRNVMYSIPINNVSDCVYISTTLFIFLALSFFRHFRSRLRVEKERGGRARSVSEIHGHA